MLAMVEKTGVVVMEWRRATSGGIRDCRERAEEDEETGEREEW